MILYKDIHNGTICLCRLKEGPPDWSLQLFPKELRAKQHASSRMALSHILDSLSIQREPQTITISHHQHIESYPNLLCSLSHTKDGWAVALIANKGEYQGVGIDLEFKNRVIKSETQKLFVNDQDRYPDLLSLWCQKEAAFKAISPVIKAQTFDKVFVLKDIFIRDGKFGLTVDGKILGFLHDEIRIFEGEQFIITSAYLTENP